jgi:hypothetical protein
MLAWKRGSQWFFAKSVKGVRPKRYFRRARDEAKVIMTENLRAPMESIVSALAR